MESLEWSHGVAYIQLLGCMLGPVTFRPLGATGPSFQPFAVAPWVPDPSLPGIMRSLRGEFSCVPYGGEQDREWPERWQAPPSDPVDAFFHGYGTHHEWSVTARNATSITLGITYPEGCAISSLERRISVAAGDVAALDISLTVNVRRSVDTTLSSHPILRMSATPGRCVVRPGGFQFGITFPLSPEPGVSRVAPDVEFTCLADVGLDRLPLPYATEELVQLCGYSKEGTISLANEEEGYVATIQFDAEVFPSVVLWVSNRGRAYAPWGGAFCALGVEPVRAAFDLGPRVGSWKGNPIAKRGVPTSMRWEPGVPLKTSYRISVAAL